MKVKVLIVQLIAPVEMDQVELLSTINQSMQRVIEKQCPGVGPFDYHVVVLSSLNLSRSGDQ